MNAFEKWFKQQHGTRAGNNHLARKRDAELRDMITTGRLAEEELRNRVDWDHRFESALYAWQARAGL